MTQNPPSGDSIRVWKEQLIRASEIKTELMNPDLIALAQVLASLTEFDDEVDADRLADNLEVDWRDPATASKAADADWALKLLSAGVLSPDSQVLLENLHFSAADRLRIEQENRGKRLSALAKVMAASKKDSDQSSSPNDTEDGATEAEQAPSPDENANQDAKEGR